MLYKQWSCLSLFECWSSIVLKMHCSRVRLWLFGGYRCVSGRDQTNWLSSFISSLFCFLSELIYISRALAEDVPDVVQQLTSTAPFAPTGNTLTPASQVFVAPWCWRNPGEKGQRERRRRDSALNSSNHFKKSSLRCTFRTRPAPWCCSIPPAPACEAQSKVMKAEKECQMITKSPRTPPHHGERRLAFYCQLHLPSPTAPNTITVLTRLKHTVAVSCLGPLGWSLTFFNAWRHKERVPVLHPPSSPCSFHSHSPSIALLR